MTTLNIPKFEYQKNEPILSDITLEISKGSITTVLGPSGCGKSTLLRILMKFEDSHIQSDASFAFVPQTSYLFPWKTVLENIVLNSQKYPGSSQRKKLYEEAMNNLKIVGLSGYENKYPFEISVGMSQRVSFARAIMNPAETLLLDEPFSALDAITRRELQNWLLQFVQKQNQSALFVTHDIAEAIYISKDIYILSQKPARIKTHFQKEGEAFINTQSQKSYSKQQYSELENDIFKELSCHPAT